MLEKLILSLVLKSAGVSLQFGEIEKFTHDELAAVNFVLSFQLEIVDDLKNDWHVGVESEIQNLLVRTSQKHKLILLIFKDGRQEIDDLGSN